MGFGNPVQPAKLAADVADAGVTSGTRTWPCRAGETDPPTFNGTGARYYTATGQPAVQAQYQSGAATVTWDTLARFSPISTARPLVVRYQLYLARSTSYQATLGFGSRIGMLLQPGGSGVLVLAAAQPSISVLDPDSLGPVIDVGAAAGFGWIDFELVFTRTLTRLTVGGNTTMGRSQTDPSDDSRIRSPFRLQQTSSTAAAVLLSNLTVSYPAQLPA